MVPCLTVPADTTEPGAVLRLTAVLPPGRALRVPADQGTPDASMTIERGPLKFQAPCIQFGEDRIWGATAIILDELANILTKCIH